MKVLKDKRTIVFFVSLVVFLCAAALCRAEIEFRFVCEGSGKSCKPYVSQEDGQKVFLEKIVSLSALDLSSVIVQPNTTLDAPPQYDKYGSEDPLAQLLLRFTSEGKVKLEEVTGRNLRRRLGIVIDGALLTVFRIGEPIVEGEVVVSGPKITRSKAGEFAVSVKRAIAAKQNSTWIGGLMNP